MPEGIEYDVMVFRFPLILERVSQIDSETVVSGFSKMVDGCGYSIVSEIDVYEQYDIDHDKYQVMIECRCIAKRGVTMQVPESVNTITIES